MTAPSEPRVLHVCEPTHAGAARVTFNLAVGIREHGYSSLVCTPPGELAQWCAAAGVDVLTLPFARRTPGSYRPAFSTIRRAMSDGCAVVHAHSSFAGVFARTARRPLGVPVVFQPHAWSFQALQGPGRAVSAAIERRLATRTDLIVCVSEQERELADAERIRPRAMTVIPNGVDFLSPPRDRTVPQEQSIVGCVARLTRQKGVDVLLRALSDPRWPASARLEIVGDGPDQAELAALARELGVAERVAFLGHLADVSDHLARWDLFVLPARYEGASIALLEALAAGLPTVCTDVAGVRALSSPERPPVPVEDPPALAAAVAAALADWEATLRIAEEMRSRAASDFSLTAQVDHTAAAYRELLGSGA
jgi:glycosyltransferase involved in cell wall biosynthesis